MQLQLGLDNACYEFKITVPICEQKGPFALTSEKVIYFQKQRKNSENF